MKTKNKRRKLDRQGIRDAFAGLPKIEHIGDPPDDLMSAVSLAYRTIATTKTGLTRDHWRTFANERVSPRLRAEALMVLPHVLIGAIDNQVIRDHCPPWELRVELKTPRRLLFHWHRIVSAEVRGQTVYHWPDRPRIEINGGSYLAAFSLHSLLRLTERLHVTTSADLLAFTRLMRCTSVEIEGNDGYWLWGRAMPPDSGRTLWLWDREVCGWLGGTMAQRLTGTDRPQDYEYRVAYVPVAYSGSFAIARTILPPAMRVAGINAELLTYQNLIDRVERAWHELAKLHDRLPMVRPVGRD